MPINQYFTKMEQLEFRNLYSHGKGADFRGNSLGPMPQGVWALNNEFLHNWWENGHDGHFDPTKNMKEWWLFAEQFEPLLEPIVGAKPGVSEVVVGNTLSTNNMLMLFVFLSRIKKSYKAKPTIVTTKEMFPSDLCTINFLKDSLGDFKILQVSTKEIYDGNFPSLKSPVLGFFPGVCHVLGKRLPIEELTRAFHKAGGLIGFDLAHSFCNHELSLHDDNVDFATFPGYKYGNGGPGAVGGIFFHKNHHEDNLFPSVPGWWGNDKIVRFSQGEITPARGARRFLASNDQVANSLGLLAHLRNVKEAGWDNVVSWNEENSTYAYNLLLNNRKIEVVTPYNWCFRGSQLSFKHQSHDAKEVLLRLKEQDLFAEKREDFVRCAFTAINSKEEVDRFIGVLEEI